MASKSHTDLGLNRELGAELIGQGAYGGQYQPRDLVGYGQHPPDPKWPEGKKVALNLVLNYEEGGENCLLHGDDKSEGLLSEIVGCPFIPDARHANIESIYDFGARSGFWRLHRMLTSRNLACTVFGVGMAMERNPDACRAMIDAKWEIASHGYRWVDYQHVDEATELKHLRETVSIHQKLFGHSPVGLYQGKPNVWTRSRAHSLGNFLYDSDSYADELPYFTSANETPAHHLVVPYTLAENDMRFVSANAYPSGREFGNYLTDHLAYLLEEARSGSTVGKMMSVGLHCRLVGRAGRAKGLADFLDYAAAQPDVWICRRDEIAKHWYENHWDPSWGEAPKVPIHNK